MTHAPGPEARLAAPPPTEDDPPSSPLRSALRLALLQPLMAVPFALFFGTLFGATLGHYLRAYQMALVFAYSIASLIWVVRHVVSPRLALACMDDRQRFGWQIGAWYVGASIVGSYVAAIIIHFTFFPGFLGSLRAVVISGFFTLLFSGLFTGINFARVFYREAVARARAVEQMRAELAEAELRALRAQIHPHFLFNTLNAIAALIPEDPAAAEEMTTRLAEVFRYTLRASGQELARLGDELDFLRAYLDIERVRFGGRLRVTEEIEPGLEAIPVPSLLLQPIVENAVRHGIGARPEGGTVTIGARRERDRLVLEVADDGPGWNGGPVPASGHGFGLHSVRERLRAAGQGGTFEIDAPRGHGARVRLSLPLPPSDRGDSQ